MKNDGPKWQFILFVAGSSPQSRRAISDLEKIIETHEPDETKMTVIDLFEEPDLAVEMDILAIPTLIRESPKPSIRIIGDLSHRDRVWSMLSA